MARPARFKFARSKAGRRGAGSGVPAGAAGGHKTWAGLPGDPATGSYLEETFAPVGKVSVNPGGEPERDETGLPPVDIEIPDDARELDRDVQAYYRELRAQRRQRRGLRARGSLAKDGIVLPLLACCLILALITGTLLTVFTATSDQNLTRHPVAGNAKVRPPSASSSAGSSAGGAASGGPASSANNPSAPASAAPPPATSQPGAVPGMLPQAIIAVDGQAPMSVHNLSQAALVLIPPHCDCTATVSWLIYVVANAHAQTYLVYSPESKADVLGVYGGLSTGKRQQVLLALETDDLLSDSIPGTPHTGPTAILIGPKKNAIYATGLKSGDNATTLIEALTH
jgi:hypothetical protein